MKKIYLFALAMFCCFQIGAQKALTMNKAVFQKEILGPESWKAVSGKQKHQHEDLYFALSKDSLAVEYLNWIEGVSGTSCTYKLEIIKDNIFELRTSNCDSGNIRFIYGYIPSAGKLAILLAEDRLKISKGLFTDPEWIEMER